MDWMYHSTTKVDPEAYLLGRSLDKSDFKEPSPTNFMRSIKDEPGTSFSQADLSRKMKEDPLTALKEKEMEEKKLLFQKLQLKRTEHLIPVSVTSMKTQEIQSKSIEQLIIENLKKLSKRIDLEDFCADLKKKKKLKKLRKKGDDTRTPTKIMSKNRSKMSSCNSDDSSNSSDEDPKSAKHLKNRDDYRSVHRKDRLINRYDSNRYNRERKKERSTDRCESKHERNNDRKSNNLHNERSRDKYRARELSDDDQSYSKKTKESKMKNGRRNSSPENIRQRASKRSESAEDSRRKERRRDEQQSKHNLRQDSPRRKIERNSKDRDMAVKKQKLSEKEKEADRNMAVKKQKLTEEEKEAKRREMMENAVKRDTERKHNVKKYALEDERENKNNNKSYRSDEFSRAQLSAYVSSENSIEQRIKSNVKNIQRGRSDMDHNFARRY